MWFMPKQEPSWFFETNDHCSAIAPVLDLVRIHPEHNVKYEIDRKSGIKLFATKNIAKGDELLIGKSFVLHI